MIPRLVPVAASFIFPAAVGAVTGEHVDVIVTIAAGAACVAGVLAFFESRIDKKIQQHEATERALDAVNHQALLEHIELMFERHKNGRK